MTIIGTKRFGKPAVAFSVCFVILIHANALFSIADNVFTIYDPAQAGWAKPKARQRRSVNGCDI